MIPLARAVGETKIGLSCARRRPVNGQFGLYIGQMNSLAVIARDVNVADRTLRRAVDLGTLRARRPSPRKLEISVLESAFIRRYWPILGELRTALSNERNVSLAILFGSLARGTASPGSDVDLAVQLKDPAFDRLLDLQVRLEARLGRKIDLLPLDELREAPSLAAAVAEEGRPIKDRDGSWPEVRAKLTTLQDQVDEENRITSALAGIERLLERA